MHMALAPMWFIRTHSRVTMVIRWGVRHAIVFLPWLPTPLRRVTPRNKRRGIPTHIAVQCKHVLNAPRLRRDVYDILQLWMTSQLNPGSHDVRGDAP